MREPPSVFGTNHAHFRVALLKINRVRADIRILVVDEREIDAARVADDRFHAVMQFIEIDRRPRINNHVRRFIVPLERPQIDVDFQAALRPHAKPIDAVGQFDGLFKIFHSAPFLSKIL